IQDVDAPHRAGLKTVVRTDELDFDLPPELIAQTPAAKRSESRLLHYRSADRSIHHRTFSDLPGLLRAGDLLVFNDTRVIPARFMLRKNTGGKVEGLYLGLTDSGEWRVMLKNLGPFSGRAQPQLILVGADDVSAQVVSKDADGTYLMTVHSDLPALEL